NKLIRDISSLLNNPRSTVSGIITKWKQLGTTATQPRSGRPRKMIEWGQHMLKSTVCRNRQLSAGSLAKDLQTLCGLQRALWNGFPWLSSCIPSFALLSAMQKVRYSGVKHVATGL
ncbi:unnamed protein product, partial [Staurois parvus]